MKQYSYGVCPYRVKNDNIQILLAQPKGHTEWGFVKGKIEDGETIAECAKRETFEETGLEIKINNLEDYFFQKNTKKRRRYIFNKYKNIKFKKIKLKKSEIFLVKFFDLYSDIKINKNQSEILSQIREYFGG